MTQTQAPTDDSGSPSSVEVVLFPAERFSPAEWRRVAIFLAAALRRTRDVDAFSTAIGIAQGQIQLWHALRGDELVGAATTRIVTYPSGHRALSIELVGAKPGSMGIDDLRSSYARLREFAVALGCDGVRLYGRRAWAKVLPQVRNQLWIGEEIL